MLYKINKNSTNLIVSNFYKQLNSNCIKTMLLRKMKQNQETDPSALSIDPASNLLLDEELNDKLDELSKDTA